MERRLKALAAAKAREAEDNARRAAEEKAREEERERRRAEIEAKEREEREREEALRLADADLQGLCLVEARHQDRELAPGCGHRHVDLDAAAAVVESRVSRASVDGR